MTWKSNTSCLTACLNALSVRDRSGCEMEAETAFLQWTENTLRIREKKQGVYLIGNGASSSMASHMAADLGKNARLRTEVLTDAALITAIGNDYGYEEVFAEPLRWRMTAGDMVVAISSSGQSPNILSGVRLAVSLEGYVVTLSAMTSNNGLRSRGDLNFYVPAMSYGTAETCHAAILHYWVDQVAKTVGDMRTAREGRVIDFENIRSHRRNEKWTKSKP
ncbi:MAG: SIS domain-containing protein [Deltaproteobacteria bacterium]|nr:SIS domain-containing protein [Deltaproteobacteria bacterium]